MQQKISTPREALEQAMWIESMAGWGTLELRRLAQLLN